MLTAINTVLKGIKNKTATFVGDEARDVAAPQQTLGAGELLLGLLGMVLFLILHLVLAKWLWNRTLPALIPAIKPATSIWQLLGLTVLLSLLHVR